MINLLKIDGLFTIFLILLSLDPLKSYGFISDTANDRYVPYNNSEDDSIDDLYFVNMAGDQPFQYRDEERSIQLFSAPSDDAKVVSEFKTRILGESFEAMTSLEDKSYFGQPVYSGLCGEKVLAIYPSTQREGDFFLINKRFSGLKKDHWVKAPVFKIVASKEESPLSYWYRQSEAIFEKAQEGKVRAHLTHYGKTKSKLVKYSRLLKDMNTSSEGLKLVCDADAIQRQVSSKPPLPEKFNEPFFVEFNDYSEKEMNKFEFPSGCWNKDNEIDHINCRFDGSYCHFNQSYIIKDGDLYIYDSVKKMVQKKELRLFPHIYSKFEKRQSLVSNVDKIFVEKGDEVFPIQKLIDFDKGILTIKDLDGLRLLAGVDRPFSIHIQGKCGMLKKRDIHARYPIYSSPESDGTEIGSIYIGKVDGDNEVAFIDKNSNHHLLSFNYYSGRCNESLRYIHQTKAIHGEWVNLGVGPWGHDAWIKKKAYGLFTDFEAGFTWMDRRNSVNFRKMDNHVYAVGYRLIGSAEGEVESRKIMIPVDYKKLFDDEGLLKAKLSCIYGC